MTWWVEKRFQWNTLEESFFIIEVKWLYSGDTCVVCKISIAKQFFKSILEEDWSGILNFWLFLIKTNSDVSSNNKNFTPCKCYLIRDKFGKCMHGSSRPEVFCKKVVLRYFTKSTGKHLYQSLSFKNVAGLRPATLLKKETLAQVFSCEFCEISNNTFLHRTLLVDHICWDLCMKWID